MGGYYVRGCPIPSRRCERRASRGKGVYYYGLWEDILETWKQEPNLFRLGCGQSTMHQGVWRVTGRRWPSHHIRRQLIYAINAGFVTYLHDHETERACTRFRLLKNGSLPKPGEPHVSNVADIKPISEMWPRVPPKGSYVIADHPITPGNPNLIFQVLEVRSDTGKIYVRGIHTMWFNVEMIRSPTDEEAANLDNYHPDEL